MAKTQTAEADVNENEEKATGGFGQQTPEQTRRNRAFATESRRRRAVVREYVEGQLAQSKENFEAASEEEREGLDNPAQVLLYGVFGFPYEENEEGEWERIAFDGGVGTGLGPDVFYFEDETILLPTLARDEDGEPIFEEVENEEGETKESAVYGDDTEVDLAEAISHYLMGVLPADANGEVKTKNGVKAVDLLQLIPGIGKVGATRILAESGVKAPETKAARSLTRRQYESVLVLAGAEGASEPEEPEVEDEAAELDEAAEEFDGAEETGEVEDDAEETEDEELEDSEEESEDDTDEDAEEELDDEGDEPEDDGDADEDAEDEDEE